VNYKTGGSHWVIDSGCTQHMTGNPRMFTSLDENDDEQDKITFGDNSKEKFKDLARWLSQMIFQYQMFSWSHL
jgi:hypothetical protein